MQNHPHVSGVVPVAAPEKPHPVIYDAAENEQTILWGDLYIDMRHLQRLAAATA